MYSMPEIGFDELSGRDGSIGLIVLKRTQVLNALNAVMLGAISHQLLEWENASHVKAVVIRSAGGRAFSAGGDIREVYARRNSEDPRMAEFFRDEYRLNHQIRSYRKPYIALLEGIVMGGGAGISVHGSHRVATDSLIFAMPETGIGFFPDVGMTYVFSHMPFAMGRYLALTGTRITRADCQALGLVDIAVKQDVFPELIHALSDTAFGNEPRDAVTEALRRFEVLGGESVLWQKRELIAGCFSKNSVKDILDALETEGSEWALETAEILHQKSPLSLKVTLSALQKAAESDFDACMEMEYTLVQHFLRDHDFFEGIRAVMIDRDQKPQWQPKRLSEVSARKVSQYFEPTGDLLFATTTAGQ